MNQKRVVFFFLGILLVQFLFFNISLISADSVSDIANDPLVGQVQQGQQQLEQFTTAENKSAYFTQAWADVLSRNKYFGGFFSVVNSVFVFLSPFFEMVLGMAYSLSYLFVFAFLIWLAFFFFFTGVLRGFFNNNLFLALVGSFAISSLIGLSGVIKLAANTIVLAISGIVYIGPFWMMIISITILCLIDMFVFFIGEIIGSFIKKKKELAAKQQEQKDRTILHTDAEISKKELESFEEGSGI